ncbi:hypothetical protein N9L13_06795 [Flavobacteriales bacterium]|nr:hypothetical protein [Flavobacteriales bacterium]
MNRLLSYLLQRNAICLLSLLICLPSAQAEDNGKPWSGTITYDVQALNNEASDWDYLPQTISYHTNGQAWKIVERGTSFERIWMGNLDGENFHVLFHFLGHAVELLEPCPPASDDSKGEWYEAAAPCPWPVSALPKSCTLRDGPATYRIAVREKVDRAVKDWKQSFFELPQEYEPMDRLSLAALMSSLSPSKD